ncbi:hypothetical protein BH10ACT2_BH10ACT2_14470 [soil metagenome]
MAKRDDRRELIKVFATDDAEAWAEIPPEQLTSEPAADKAVSPARSRRGVALVGAVACITAIAAVVALTDDGNSDSSATTTIVAPPTTRAPLDPLAAAHYLIDDPALTPYSADIVTPPSDTTQVRVYTDGTAVGPIVIIELHPYTYQPYGIVGATRDIVDGIEVARSPDYCPTAAGPSYPTKCSLLRSEVAIDSDWSITVRATRLSDARFVQVVRNLHVINGVLAEDLDVMRSIQLGLTFEADSLDTLIFGAVESSVRYLTANGEIATLRSAIGVADDRVTSMRYLTVDAQPSFYDRTYGSLLGKGNAIVVWEENGRLLSLTGPLDPAELSRISRNARPATDSEWTGMVYGLRPDFTLGDFATVATGQGSQKEFWRAGPQIAQRAGQTEFLWWWSVPGRDNFADSALASFVVGHRPHLETVVVPGATYVFVSQPDTGGTVIVRASDGTEYSAELVQPFTQSSVYMSVVRIEEPGPVTATINGVVVGG